MKKRTFRYFIVAWILALALLTAGYGNTLKLFAPGTALAENDADYIEQTKEAQEVLTGAGILDGAPDGSYKPSGEVTRAEAAAMIARMMLGKEDADKLRAGDSQFSDVPEDHWAARYIKFCADKGIIVDIGDGKFNPDEPVTGTQLAVMLQRALGYGVAGEYEGKDWDINAVADALYYGVFKDSNLKDFNEPLTSEMSDGELMQWSALQQELEEKYDFQIELSTLLQLKNHLFRDYMSPQEYYSWLRDYLGLDETKNDEDEDETEIDEEKDDFYWVNGDGLSLDLMMIRAAKLEPKTLERLCTILKDNGLIDEMLDEILTVEDGKLLWQDSIWAFLRCCYPDGIIRCLLPGLQILNPGTPPAATLVLQGEKAELVFSDVNSVSHTLPVNNKDLSFKELYKAMKAAGMTGKDPNYPLQVTVQDQTDEYENTVLIVAGSARKVYDGTPLTCPDIESVSGLPEGYSLAATTSGSQTDVGYGTNKVSSWTILDADGKDVTSSFPNVKTQDGKLAVKPRTLKIVTQNAQKTYDGEPLKNDNVTIEGLIRREPVTVTAIGSTEAGTYENTYEIDWGSANAKNYTIRDTLGTLTVAPASLTVTTGSAQKEYDGSPLTCADVTVDGLRGSDVITVTPVGSVTEIGSAENAFTIDWGTVNPENYIVIRNPGLLTVTAPVAHPKGEEPQEEPPQEEKPQEEVKHDETVIFTAASASKTYDGKPLTSNDVAASGLPEGFTFTAVTEGSRTDVGMGENLVSSYAIFNSAGQDVTMSFTNVKKQKGNLTVAPALLAVSTGSASKAYDGTALTAAEAGITGLVNGETVTVTAAGSRTVPGESTNTYSIEWGTTSPDNYTVSETLGTLTVTNNSTSIVITAASASKVYDGTALTASGIEPVTGLPAGHTAVATVSGSLTNAGTAESTVDSYAVKNAAGEDVTKYFSGIKTAAGTLTVKPAAVTITTGSASKAYDGTALTAAEAGITGLVTGETAAVTATGSQTVPGESTNSYSVDWGIASPDNYTVSETLGTLSVTENSTPIVITAASASKVYDGTALTASGIEEVTGLPAGHTAEATVSGSLTKTGSVENTVDSYAIKNAAGEDVTKYFSNVSTVEGELTVSPRVVNVMIENNGKIVMQYTGQALRYTQYMIPEGSFAPGDLASGYVTSDQVDVGEGTLRFVVENKTDSMDLQNYYFVVEGSLTIEPANGPVTEP